MQTPQPLSTPLFRRPAVRTTTAAALLVLGACLAAAPLTASRVHAQTDAATEASAQTSGGGDFRLFYDKLTDGGNWLQTNEYGYVFQPEVATQDRDWRPYTDGYWAQTDQGWTWVSNESFGWACYHYGRWANLVDTGWVWVPGAEWAPAYVSWRFSKDHKTVGWAALPPEARITKTAGVERWADSAYDIGPESYNFVETSRLSEGTTYRGHLLPADRATTVFTESENVTNVTYRTVSSRSVIYSGGPDVAVIREVSGRPVRTLQLDYQERPADFFVSGNGRGFNSVNGDRFVVSAAAPDVVRSTSIQIREPRNVSRRLPTVEVNRGYRGLRDPQEADRIRAAVRTQAPLPPEVERQTATLRERGGNNRREANVPGATTPIPANREAAPAGTPAAGRATPAPSALASPGTASTPTPDRNPAATGGQTPPAAVSPSPAGEPGRPPRRAGAENRATLAPERPEASPTPRRNATPPPADATPRPSSPKATPAREEQRPERRGDTPRPREATPAPEREAARPQATPAADREKETPRNRRETPETGEGRGDNKADKGEKARPEATPAREGGGGNRGETPRRETPPAATRGESARPETPAGGANRGAEAPAKRQEAERPERGNPAGAGGANNPASAPRGGAERSGGAEKKANPEAAGEGKAKATPQP